MHARYSERIHAKGRVLITVGKHVSEGQILNLTVPGCLIESPLSVKKGDSLQLKLILSGVKSSFDVALAVVRWTSGFQFGVEFIEMKEKDQRQLNEVIARHQPNRASKKTKGTRQQFSDPTAHNWHLESYSLADEGQGAASETASLARSKGTLIPWLEGRRGR